MMEPLLTAPMAVPPIKGLFPALEAVAPFVDERHGIAWFTGGAVRAGSAEGADWTASVEVKDLPEGIGAHAASILSYKDDIETLWLGDPAAQQQPRVVLFGKGFRAAVLGMLLAREKPEEAPPAPLAPQAPTWGTGQVTEASPPPPGWGQAAQPGGAPTSDPHAAPSASGTTAQGSGWGQPATGNVEASPSSPLPDAGSQTVWNAGNAPLSEPATSAPEPGSSVTASHSEQAPTWHIAKAPTPPEGQEPSLSGAPGWDNVRAQEQAQGQQQPGGWGSPGGWGNFTPNVDE
jgi:hypothetical protein